MVLPNQMKRLLKFLKHLGTLIKRISPSRPTGQIQQSLKPQNTAKVRTNKKETRQTSSKNPLKIQKKGSKTLKAANRSRLYSGRLTHSNSSKSKSIQYHHRTPPKNPPRRS